MKLLPVLVLLVSISRIYNQDATVVEQNQNDTDSPESIYENVFRLKNQLIETSESIASEYWRLVNNDTDSKLSNWKAYSIILKQINYALFDMISETLVQSDLVEKISEQCEKSLTDFSMALVRQDPWAYKMVDANGFLSSGMLEGSFTNFGDFDECIEATDQEPNQEIRGQYCLIKFHLEIPTNSTSLIAQDVVFNTSGTILENTFLAEFLRYAHYFKVRQGRAAICMPSPCNKTDIQLIMDYVLQVDKLAIQVDTCQTAVDNGNYSPLQKTIIIIMGLITLFIILATLIEWYGNVEREILLIFLQKLSIKHNLHSLLISNNGDNLASINGLRVLTMFWLVYGHAYLLSVKEAFRSSTHFIHSLFDVKMYFLFNAWPVVDIFFILSALLHSYRAFQILQSQNRINILRIICNRIARLWPSLWIIVALVFVIPQLAQGPLWVEIMDQQVNTCYQNWWMIITFTANLRTETNLCQIHTWYLSADMQLFLVSFVFILLIHRFQRRAIVVMSVINLLFCSFITIYFYLNRFHPTILFNQIDEMEIYKEMFKIYMPTYLHLTPYLVGIVTGYLLTVHKPNNFIFPKSFNILWIISILFVLMVILSGYLFTTYPDAPMIVQSFYAGFHRLAWSLSIAFIIFCCETSRQGIIKDFLSNNCFVPLSKVCYLIYLIHFIITWTRYAYQRQPLVFSHYTMFNEFIINSVYSVCLASLIYVLVEAPFSNLYSLYLGQKSWTFGEFRLNAPKRGIHKNDTVGSGNDMVEIEMN